MNNGINFFSWIRDGVKQSVLLGVSDAIETIGAPEDSKSLHPHIAALVRHPNQDGSEGASLARLTGNPPASKKRLGKSLRDIGPTSES